MCAILFLLDTDLSFVICVALAWEHLVKYMGTETSSFGNFCTRFDEVCCIKKKKS